MISQQKRVVLVAILSFVLIVAGIAISMWGNGRYGRTLSTEIAGFDIKRHATANELNVDDLAYKLAGNGLIVALGATCVAGGAIGLILSGAIWIWKPSLGSTLTFRGWKTPGERSAGAVAADKAWQAAMFGFFGSLPWIFPFCLGTFRSLLLPSDFATRLIVLLLVECGIFYGFGIRLCRRRDRAAASIAKTPWRVAFALNYGGLCAFLIFIAALFVMRSRLAPM
jgi:hypothetical protein